MIYKLIESHDDVPSGTIVAKAKFYDYGLSSDDTRLTGVHHISVTKDLEGGYPFFTIPTYKLVEVTNHSFVPVDGNDSVVVHYHKSNHIIRK